MVAVHSQLRSPIRFEASSPHLSWVAPEYLVAWSPCLFNSPTRIASERRRFQYLAPLAAAGLSCNRPWPPANVCVQSFLNSVTNDPLIH